MKRSNIVFLLIIIMAGVGIYKTKFAGSGKVNPESQTTIQQNDKEDTSLVLTDEGVGLTDEAKKSIVTTVIENPIPEDSDEQSTSNSSMEADPITVTGPNTLPKEECMKKYKNVIPDIAAYTSKGEIPDYYICHAIADNNISFCPSQKCEKEVQRLSFFHKSLTGDIRGAIDICKKVIIPEASFASMSGQAACSAYVEVVKGSMQPPDAYRRQFREFLASSTGRVSACSVIKDQKHRYSCILQADLVNGLKTGIAKYYPYEAFKNKNCSQIDYDLLSRYCSNKLLSRDEVEARLSPQDRKIKMKNKTNR